MVLCPLQKILRHTGPHGIKNLSQCIAMNYTVIFIVVEDVVT